VSTHLDEQRRKEEREPDGQEPNLRGAVRVGGDQGGHDVRQQHEHRAQDGQGAERRRRSPHGGVARMSQECE